MVKNLILSGSLILVVLLVYQMCFSTRDQLVYELSYSDLRRAIEANNVKSAVIMGNVVWGSILQTRKNANFGQKYRITPLQPFADAMYQKGIDVRIEHGSSWKTAAMLAIIAFGVLLSICACRAFSRRAGASQKISGLQK